MYNRIFKVIAPVVVVAIGTSKATNDKKQENTTPQQLECRPGAMFSGKYAQQKKYRFGTTFNEPTLESFIPASHTPRPVQDQCLSKWVSDSTKDYQLLTFSPKNLTVQIAFLRLIGIPKISLDHLGREKGTTTCFISTLDIVPFVKSKIITSVTDVVDSINEFGDRKGGAAPIKSLAREIADPILHVEPSIITDAQEALDNGSLEQFYRIFAESSDDKLAQFAHHLLGSQNNNPALENILFQQLLVARLATQVHIESMQYMSTKNSSRIH